LNESSLRGDHDLRAFPVVRPMAALPQPGSLARACSPLPSSLVGGDAAGIRERGRSGVGLRTLREGVLFFWLGSRTAALSALRA
jgi:hypothetical protein